MPAFNRISPRALDHDMTGATQLLKGIMKLIDELVKIMNQEIALIETRKMKDHAELLKRKQRLTIDYRASLKSIALQPDLLKQVPDDVRQAAKFATKKLAEATERNAKILRAAIMASEKLAQTIVAIVKDEVLPKSGYVNPYAERTLLGTYSPTCKPVTGSRTA